MSVIVYNIAYINSNPAVEIQRNEITRVFVWVSRQTKLVRVNNSEGKTEASLQLSSTLILVPFIGRFQIHK